MSIEYEYVVEGLPAPKGSKTLMRGRLVEGSSTTGRRNLAAWADAVTLATALVVSKNRLREPLDGPLHVEIDFRFPMPKSRLKAVREAGSDWKSTKPDLDKLARATWDAMVTGRLIHDDARVASTVLSKIEVAEGHGEAGATIRVRQSEPRVSAALFREG